MNMSGGHFEGFGRQELQRWEAYYVMMVDFSERQIARLELNLEFLQRELDEDEDQRRHQWSAQNSTGIEALRQERMEDTGERMCSIAARLGTAREELEQRRGRLYELNELLGSG